MVNILRKYRQPLMITFTIFTIFSFVFFYNNYKPERGGGGPDRVGTVYGRGVSPAQFLRGARKFELGRDLGLSELLQSLAAPAQTEQQAKENFVFNGIVMAREAARLGVATTDEEAETAIKEMQVFQTAGQFDSQRYNLVVQNFLTPRGFNPEQIEELVREDITVKKLKALLGTTTAPNPAEVRQAVERENQKTECSVVRFKLDDFLKTVNVKDDDLKKAYEERKTTLNAPEKRKVKYLAFTLEDSAKPLAGKDRVDALKKQMDRATDFTQAMLEKDAKLEDVAAKAGVAVKASPEFTADAPPAEFGANRNIAEIAFHLTKAEPNSDVIQTDKGYYVLQLDAIVPARPLTFDEAKDKLAEALKHEQATEALNLKGALIRTKIESELKAAKSFADAAAAAGVKADAFPPFSLRDRKFNEPDGQEVMMSAFDLAPGTVSSFSPTASGGLLVYVSKRDPIDAATFEKEKGATIANISRSIRESLFEEWLKARRKEAGLQTTARDRAA